MQTWELMRAAIPTRHEKARVGHRLGLKSESQVYAYCEDPTESGRPNPLDKADVVFEHALLHHPDVAATLVQRWQIRMEHVLGARGRALPVLQLVAVLHPGIAKEATEAALAAAEALRQGVLGGDCEGEQLVRELEEGARTLTQAAVQIRSAMVAAVTAN